MMTALHPHVADYLARLDAEARRLPAEEARDLMSDIRGHLEAALGEHPTDAEVLSALDRLGSPTELVDEAGGVATALPPPVPPSTIPPSTAPRQVGGVEITALVALLGAELVFILWFVSLPLWIVGLVLLGVAPAWTAREKLLGFAALATGLPVVMISTIGIALGSSEALVCESNGLDSTCTSASAGLTWVNYVAIAVAVGYLALQVWTVWRLTRGRTTRA